MVSKKRIAVTGYGSFGCYTTNPSSVIVDNLEKLEFSDGIELLTETIPVEYAAAERCSTRLCKDVKPDFIVHIGVNGEWEDCIQLELQSFSHGYWSADVDGKVPFMNRSSLEAEEDVSKILKTSLDCASIIENIDKNYPDLCIETSDNPGRFLCAYIYYLSLAQYCGKAIFIHVPKFNETIATPDQLTSVIVDIIKEIAKQL